MELPAGKQNCIILDPTDRNLVHHIRQFIGVVEIMTCSGKGFILIRNSELVAAFFEEKDGIYLGDAAIRYIMAQPDSGSGTECQQVVLRPYSEQEYAETLKRCTENDFVIGITPPNQESVHRHINDNGASGIPSCVVDESALTKIMAQPGVVAVSAFYEGFPVYSLGNADFEHIAARAEDLFRAGTTIALDMSLGQPDQLLLETAENKFIITSVGDLCLCIIAGADAQLDFIRSLLKSMQLETEWDL